MDLAALRCPHCAAALDATKVLGRAIRCPFCGCGSQLLANEGAAVRLEHDEPDAHPGKLRIEVDGLRLVLLGKLASGESSEVFLGCTDRRLSERVVVKLLRTPTDSDLLRREWKTLGELVEAENQGATYFTTLLPQPVCHGLVRGASTPRLASVFRFRPGFVHTLDDVRRALASGAPPVAAVWIWKRLLELLGWVHRAGHAHGAVLPRHILVQPRDHGVALVGWSCASRLEDRAPLIARVDDAPQFYPEPRPSALPPTPELDLAMAARCVVAILGGDASQGEPPPSVPGPLFGLLRACARMDLGTPADAWELREEVSQAARAALGPSRFQPLSLPGWR